MVLFVSFTLGKMSKDTTYFNEDWLSDKDFKKWVRRAKSNTQYYCSVCRKMNELSNMGEKALKSHVGSSDTHKKNQKSFDNFFKPKGNEKQNVSDSAGPSSASNTQVIEMTQTKLTDVVGNTSVVVVEVCI